MRGVRTSTCDSFACAEVEFIDNDEEASPGTGDGGDGSGSRSPLLLEPRDPDAPPPDWNLAREPVPDMVNSSCLAGGSGAGCTP